MLWRDKPSHRGIPVGPMLVWRTMGPALSRKRLKRDRAGAPGELARQAHIKAAAQLVFPPSLVSLIQGDLEVS